MCVGACKCVCVCVCVCVYVCQCVCVCGCTCVSQQETGLTGLAYSFTRPISVKYVQLESLAFPVHADSQYSANKVDNAACTGRDLWGLARGLRKFKKLNYNFKKLQPKLCQIIKL